MTRKGEIDNQMPFSQVDRIAPGRAGLLAGQLGVTQQHALGGMVNFWMGLGDRRLLQQAMARSRAAGKDEPELIFSEGELLRRLRLALSLKDLSVGPFEDCGFVAPAEGGWRVKGVHRYFVTEGSRLKQKSGGLDANLPRPTSSAQYLFEEPPRPSGEGIQLPQRARPTPLGPPKPVVPGRSTPCPPLVNHRSTTGPPTGPPTGEPLVNHRSTTGPPTGEPVVDPGSTEVRGKSLFFKPPPPTPPPEPPRARQVEEEEVGKIWEGMQSEREEHGQLRDAHCPDGFASFVAQALHGWDCSPPQIVAAYRRYLEDSTFEARRWPVRVFMVEKVFRPRVPEPRRAGAIAIGPPL